MLVLFLKTKKHYNAGPNNPNYGKTWKMSEESNLKNRLAHLGRKHTEESKLKMSLSMKGKSRTEETKERIRLAKLKDKNPMWKGDKVGMKALHEWVTNHFPKTNLCQICNKIPPHDLANISGEYKRDLDDWNWLCRRCHMLSDGRMNNLKQGR